MVKEPLVAAILILPIFQEVTADEPTVLTEEEQEWEEKEWGQRRLATLILELPNFRELDK